MMIAREPRRGKLELNIKVITFKTWSIDQVFKINYLGITISSYGEIKNGVRNQVNTAARIAEALRTTIREKHMHINPD